MIQWYPGHMARAMRRIGDALRLVDVVVEAIDARVPASGSNPALRRMIGRKRHIVVLTRNDLADPRVTRAWIDRFERSRTAAIALDAREPRNVGRVVSLLSSPTRRSARVMVVGIPNSGKSTIVNGLLRRAAAKTERRAGVTRAVQWFRLSPGVEVMDTPGILVPKIATRAAQWKLAAVGAVPSERYDPEEVAHDVARWAAERGLRRVPSLEAFAAERGFVRRRGKVDAHNAAQSYLRAFEQGTFGRISLESPDDTEAA